MPPREWRWLSCPTSYLCQGASMLFYPAALPLPARTLAYLAGVIRRHRKNIGSCWRKLNPGRRPRWYWPICAKVTHLLNWRPGSASAVPPPGDTSPPVTVTTGVWPRRPQVRPLGGLSPLAGLIFPAEPGAQAGVLHRPDCPGHWRRADTQRGEQRGPMGNAQGARRVMPWIARCGCGLSTTWRDALGRTWAEPGWSAAGCGRGRPLS
jgi:hypothetical protein